MTSFAWIVLCLLLLIAVTLLYLAARLEDISKALDELADTDYYEWRGSEEP